MPTLALIGVPLVILPAITTISNGEAFALPARTVVIGWQSSYDVAPGAINVRLEVAMDEAGPWTQIDVTTVVGGEFRTIAVPTAARFIRARPATNADPVAVTIQIICKVANP